MIPWTEHMLRAICKSALFIIWAAQLVNIHVYSWRCSIYKSVAQTANTNILLNLLISWSLMSVALSLSAFL